MIRVDYWAGRLECSAPMEVARVKGMLNHRRPPSRYPRTEAEGRAAMALCQYACALPRQAQHSAFFHPAVL